MSKCDVIEKDIHEPSFDDALQQHVANELESWISNIPGAVSSEISTEVHKQEDGLTRLDVTMSMTYPAQDYNPTPPTLTKEEILTFAKVRETLKEYDDHKVDYGWMNLSN